jgi:hypothetical protein
MSPRLGRFAARSGPDPEWIVLDLNLGPLPYHPSWLKLVRTSAAGYGFQGVAEVVGQGVSGGDGLPSGLDLDGAVAVGGLDEFPDRPACLCFDPPADGQRGEHDGQVRLDGGALAVADRPGLQV